MRGYEYFQNAPYRSSHKTLQRTSCYYTDAKTEVNKHSQVIVPAVVFKEKRDKRLEKEHLVESD
jgi:hypothetical protein